MNGEARSESPNTHMTSSPIQSRLSDFTTANGSTGQAARECTSRLWDLANREAIPDVAEFNKRPEVQSLVTGG
jgi:hypothetical protein